MMYCTVHYCAVQTFFIWDSYQQTEQISSTENSRICLLGPDEQTKEKQIYIYDMHVTCLYVLVVNYFMFV
jgi:hypothetical protein